MPQLHKHFNVSRNITTITPFRLNKIIANEDIFSIRVYKYRLVLVNGRTQDQIPKLLQPLNVRAILFEYVISKKEVNSIIKLVTMSREEIKYEISKVLDHFSDKALGELLAFLKELDTKKEVMNPLTSSLNKILSEDKELLAKLAQ